MSVQTDFETARDKIIKTGSENVLGYTFIKGLGISNSRNVTIAAGLVGSYFFAQAEQGCEDVEIVGRVTNGQLIPKAIFGMDSETTFMTWPITVDNNEIESIAQEVDISVS